MKVVMIGKGMCRITVRSPKKRQRLSRIPEVSIHGNRVIFPIRFLNEIELIINPPGKVKKPENIQTELF